MKWLIGLDLKASSTGAVAFAAWLARHSSSERFAAVHVIEESYLLQVLRSEHLARAQEDARDRVEKLLGEAGLRDRVETYDAVRGTVADQRLEAEAHNVQADVLLVGRQARADELKFVRLGRVARRLCRRLPVPTVVVPPELEVASIGDGPIMLATAVAEEDVEAARFAHEVARATGRSLLVAHILPDLGDEGNFVPAATLRQLYDQLGMDRERDIQKWMKKHDLGDASVVLAQGEVVGRLIGIAQQEHVPLIVCGSRMLSGAERVMVASIATQLSCHAACPVAVVPPHPQG